MITVFLCSLTQNWDSKIIAVIVSGYDGDGAEALCRIKEVRGISIAQKPETATQPKDISKILRISHFNNHKLHNRS